MQRLVAEYADVWDCWKAFGDSDPEAYRLRRAAMEAACERHGRDPATMGRHVGVSMVLLRHAVEFPGGVPLPQATPLAGSPSAVAERSAAFGAEGVEHIMINTAPMTAAEVEWLAPVLEAVQG